MVVTVLGAVPVVTTDAGVIGLPPNVALPKYSMPTGNVSVTTTSPVIGAAGA